MTDDWLAKLHQLHEADKIEQKPKKSDQAKKNKKRQKTVDLLRQSRAHELLRQMQKALLKGQGTLDIFERAGDYERAIALVWQGSISAARRPSPDDPEEYRYILVGVRAGKLWVNDAPLPQATPEALKAALLEAAQNPAREKPES